MLIIKNKTKEEINGGKIRQIYARTLQKFKINIKKAECGLHIIDKKEIQKLNKKYRRIDRSTDVLSFPINQPLKPDSRLKIKDLRLILGDLFICPEMVDPEIGIEKTFKHGLFHLLGLSHKEMGKQRDNH